MTRSLADDMNTTGMATSTISSTNPTEVAEAMSAKTVALLVDSTPAVSRQPNSPRSYHKATASVADCFGLASHRASTRAISRDDQMHGQTAVSCLGCDIEGEVRPLLPGQPAAQQGEVATREAGAPR